MVGAFMGGLLLGAVLAAANLVLTAVGLDGARLPVTAAALVVIVVVEWRFGGLGWLAGNFTIPAAWVNGDDFRAGTLWGTVLGSGYITQAPHAVLHAASVAAILQPHWPVAVGAGLALAVGRIATTVPRGIRSRISAGMDPEGPRPPGRPVAIAAHGARAVLVAVCGLLLAWLVISA